MTVIHIFMRTKIPMWVIGALSAIVADPAHSQSDRILESKGDWQVVRSSGSFDQGGSSCIIRSSNEIEGGRRKRPRVRLNLSASKLFVDPDVYLSGIITAIAVIEERTVRSQPERSLLHRMRIDSHEIIQAKDANPRFGRWTAHDAVSDFSKFVAQMDDGRRLFYEWKIGRAGKFYEFELAGFRAMKKLLKTHPDCVKEN